MYVIHIHTQNHQPDGFDMNWGLEFKSHHKVTDKLIPVLEIRRVQESLSRKISDRPRLSLGSYSCTEIDFGRFSFF